jgi:hypothetical protein
MIECPPQWVESWVNVVGHDDALTTVQPGLELAGKMGRSGFSVRKHDPARPAYPKFLLVCRKGPPGALVDHPGEGSAQRETASC